MTNYCPQCGQALENGGSFCGHCGYRVGEILMQMAAGEEPTADAILKVPNKEPEKGEKSGEPLNLCAILGLVLVLIAVFVDFFALLSIAAIILAVIGRVQIMNRGGRGKGMTTAVFVIGGINIFSVFIRMVLLVSGNWPL